MLNNALTLPMYSMQKFDFPGVNDNTQLENEGIPNFSIKNRYKIFVLPPKSIAWDS
jgi:hypothetical protein